jgi:ketosteroid isomerase-like protein
MSALTATLSLPLTAPTTHGQGRSQSLLSKERVVARLFEAFSGRRLEDALPMLTEDVVFQPMTAQVTRAGAPYIGHDGIRQYMADVEEHWEELTLHPTQIKAAGEAVVAMGLVSGSGKGARFEDAPTTWMFKFRGDRVASATIFSSAAQVLEALEGEGG